MPTQRPILRVSTPGVAGYEHLLSKAPVTIGRGSDCTLPIRDRYLSRKHAEILPEAGAWVLRDCGSANGTFINGSRVQGETLLRPGDRISIGDTSLLFEDQQVDTTSTSFAISERTPSASIVIPIADLDITRGGSESERLSLFATIALELIEDRPAESLFQLVVDRVHQMLSASRTAIAIFEPGMPEVAQVIARGDDQRGLTLSRTMLSEVIDGRKAVAWTDLDSDDKLARAKSIVGQSIRSAACAPLLAGERVLGVLYVDFLLTQRDVADADVRLLAQIAKLAATRLETTRLRQEALAKKRMEEELETAYTVQKRLLPACAPVVEGYAVAGVNKPARTVSGDYYGYVVRPDGRMYFVIADVAGKGITAALVMASLASAFDVFANDDLSPADLVEKLNRILVPKMTLGKFVTLFAGVLHPDSGFIEFANAGHCLPLVLSDSEASELGTTDLVLGLFPEVKYTNQSMFLQPGDALMLFTDGIIEAEDAEGEELGGDAIVDAALAAAREGAEGVMAHVLGRVREHTGGAAQLDDITMLVVSRDGPLSS